MIEVAEMIALGAVQGPAAGELDQLDDGTPLMVEPCGWQRTQYAGQFAQFASTWDRHDGKQATPVDPAGAYRAPSG
jgi:hypothetical protein